MIILKNIRLSKMQTLIPLKLLNKLPNLYDTENIKDPICHIKLFTPDSNWTWYITEISKKNNDTCFGLVSGHSLELGYFNLDEQGPKRTKFKLAEYLSLFL